MPSEANESNALPGRAESGPQPDGPISPGTEPSALERGVRIFERLNRRAAPDQRP